MMRSTLATFTTETMGRVRRWTPIRKPDEENKVRICPHVHGSLLQLEIKAPASLSVDSGSRSHQPYLARSPHDPRRPHGGRRGWRQEAAALCERLESGRGHWRRFGARRFLFGSGTLMCPPSAKSTDQCRSKFLETNP